MAEFLERQPPVRPHPVVGEMFRDNYERELSTPAIGEDGNMRKIHSSVKCLIRAVRQLPVVDDMAVGASDPWVWSDQHFGHSKIIKYCQRPFASVDQMDAAFFARWEWNVNSGDTMIFVGDVAMKHGYGRHTQDRLRAMPGAVKHLVVGNHDVGRGGKLLTSAFQPCALLLDTSADPPLIFTHVPLRSVPDGWVNVHGHTHNNEAPGDSPHINVCVEQLDYRPERLSRLRGLAAALVDGHVPPGNTTIERLRALDAAAALMLRGRAQH